MTSSTSGVFSCATSGTGRIDQSSVDANKPDLSELPTLSGDDLDASPDAAPFFTTSFFNEDHQQ